MKFYMTQVIFPNYFSYVILLWALPIDCQSPIRMLDLNPLPSWQELSNSFLW